ncbi:MAG: sensor histidine kinase [Rhodoferax sp.]|uniref:sensor histidine kinase n=1 Tax=Rhodoferax sp. TaxID=50421 RepID=UPI0030184615
MGLHESASLSGHLAALRDVSGLLRIEDVTVPAKAAEFTGLPGFLGAGYTTDTYWLRFTLQRTVQVPDQWLLEVTQPYLNHVTLFAPRSDGGFDATHLGDLQPFADRPIPHRSFVFPVRLVDDRPITLYLRIKTSSTMLVRVQAWQYAGLLSSAQTDTSLFSVYFGILALGIMSNLVFWFWLRERIYLSYCGYLSMLAIVMMTTNGFASQWVLSHQPLVASRLVGVSVCLVFLIGTHFFVGVLRLRVHFPKLNRLFDAVLIFYALCALAAILGKYGVVAPWLMLVVAIMNVGITLAGPWLLWRGHREYLFYTLAFTANFLAIPFAVAKLMGWTAINIPTDYITVLGSIIHIVLLNIAVVDRVRHAEQETLLNAKLAAELAAERDAVNQQRQFVAMVSHEFRTPLAVIDATAQSVEIACSQSATASYEFIAPRQEKIRRAVRRMVSLLDNFLTHERLDFDGHKIHGETLDLRDLANEAAKNWKHLLHTSDQLRLEMADTVVPVHAERAMMRLALSNLIDNAIKYAPLGSPITLRVGKSLNNGWIEVEDHGIGISTKETGQIFEKFYRGGNAQMVPGAGLGLYLVRSIINAEGGEIDIESTVGEGSLFRLRLALVA